MLHGKKVEEFMLMRMIWIMISASLRILVQQRGEWP